VANQDGLHWHPWHPPFRRMCDAGGVRTVIVASNNVSEGRRSQNRGWYFVHRVANHAICVEQSLAYCVAVRVYEHSA
jgi:hypothetical protein